MACQPKRVLTALLATVIGLLALAAPASARVSIVPGQTEGGGTKTFAFRLANERPDTASNRLELVFPQDPPIAFVEVAQVEGWTATIRPRPLTPPVKVGDREITEVAASVVLEGGTVPPGQFEQFLITMGPLPQNGELAFEATQGFTNGAVERWTNASGPGSPVITIGNPSAQGTLPAPPPPDAEAQDSSQQPVPAYETPPREVASSGLSPLAVLAIALGFAAIVVAGVGYQAMRSRRSSTQSPADEPMDVFDDPDDKPRTDSADSAEVAGR